MTIAPAFAVASILAIGASAWIIHYTRTSGSARTASALRSLLMERAEGKVSAEEFEQRQAAIQALLLSDPEPGAATQWLWGIPVAILGAAAAYAWLAPDDTAAFVPPVAKSEPGSLPKMNFDTDKEAGKEPKSTGGDLRDQSRRLAEKLAKDPDNGVGWLLLARSYREIRQLKEADEAFAKADKLLPPDASMLADWADTYVIGNDRKWDAKAKELVSRALKADPKHLKSLALAGSAAFDQGDYKAAAGFWKRMKAAAPPDSMEAREADANLAEAESRIKGSSGKPPADR
jgi:cytochrome c-type biogenesis protein CcmH